MTEPTKTTIGDLLRRLPQKIEEIVKVDQSDPETVYDELTEYVATKSIVDQYRRIFHAMQEAHTQPTEDVGIWVSGFFGSGKSSFAKNLGYVLANREVLGERAAALFKRQLDDPEISASVDFINAAIPTHVIMFDVMVDHAVHTQNEKMAEIMYRVLLREMGYAQDFTIAALEIELEHEGDLDAFREQCQETIGIEWEKVRAGAQKISRASRILHALKPEQYPTPGFWQDGVRGRETTVTIRDLVDRTFELADLKLDGKAVAFVIDEVGQYVARSSEKLEDLRAVVEHFGQESQNRLKRREIKAPVWIIVTSQEKLGEVIDAVDFKRGNLPKLQDRFPDSIRADLSPSDIRQVATQRILRKKPAAEPVLQKLFSSHQGVLKAATQLENSQISTTFGQREFVDFYPYLPHYVELSIEIMSGIRLQPGAPKQLGGSNRTMIKQAHSMLTGDRTHVARDPIGRLVSLDLVYDLVEGNLPSERRKDLTDVAERLGPQPGDDGWSERTAKALALLEFVRNLPRTPANVASVLLSQVGDNAPVQEVAAALQRLEAAQFVTQDPDGFKLLTREEKSWEQKRRELAHPKARERKDIVREALEEIFGETELTTVRYKNVQTLHLEAVFEGASPGRLRVGLELVPVEVGDSVDSAAEGARQESHTVVGRNRLFWVFPLSAGVDQSVRDLYASKAMVAAYERVGGEKKMTMEEERSLLPKEKQRVLRL
jgi:hypothetical protein